MITENLKELNEGNFLSQLKEIFLSRYVYCGVLGLFSLILEFSGPVFLDFITDFFRNSDSQSSPKDKLILFKQALLASVIFIAVCFIRGNIDDMRLLMSISNFRSKV